MTGLSRKVVLPLAILLLFVAVTIAVRGEMISSWAFINPDEAELMAQARAALLSPIPFTTWTLGTTGPFWVLFLALLGALGYPLTIVAAHLLAAVLVALMGFSIFVLLRRSFGFATGLVLSVFWWLPVALVYPVGGSTNFGGLATELLPSLLVLLAALIPAQALEKHPALFLVVGVLCGLAIGAKYQVLPVAAALVIIRLFATPRPIRALLAPAALFVAGVIVPFALVLASMLFSPDSFQLLGQNLAFLGTYAGAVDLGGRVANTVHLLLQPYLFAALLVLVRAGMLSTRRILVLRIIVMLFAVFAVFAGGMAFGHYLIVLYAGLALALALPLRPGAVLVPAGLWSRLAPVVGALFVVILLVFGLATGRTAIATPSAVAESLSPNSVIRSSALEKVCPEGSAVLVWGWAAELYVNYSWRNTVPFMNSLSMVSNEKIRDVNEPIIANAIGKSDCVVDAVGAPFFGFGPDKSLLSVYPQFSDTIGSDFAIARGVVDCDSCTVYIRK